MLFHYNSIAPKAIEVKEKFNLSDTQTAIYNHICRGDFRIRNEGFGGDRTWIKKQLKPLLKAGLVEITTLHDCRSAKMVSWNFHCPEYRFDTLVSSDCYVTAHKLALIKHYLNLEDGFNKVNVMYGDIEFIRNGGYSFKYKGEGNIYCWDYNGKGIKQVGINREFKTTFSELVHDIWSFLAHDGFEDLTVIPNYIRCR